MIVLSILLAFFVDASWDGVQERSRERDYLLSLQGEFGAARTELGASLDSRSRVQGRVLSLLLQAQGAPRVPEDSLYLWSSALSQQLEFDPPRAILDDLISSGESHLVADTLRLALARYRSALETMQRRDDQAWAIWENRIQSLLEGRIPRTNRLIRGTYGMSQQVPFGLSTHGADWEGVLSDPVVEDTFAERWMRLSLARAELVRIQSRMDEITPLIRERLDQLR